MIEHDIRKKRARTPICTSAMLILGFWVPSLVRHGVSVPDFAAGRLRAPIAMSAALLLLAAPAWAQSSHGHHHTPSPSPSPPSSPTLTLTFNPQMPSVQDTVPLGTVIATVTAAWSDGSSFTGTLTFGSPYADDGGTFALSCQSCATANIVVSPTGLGLMGDGGTVQEITVVAAQ